MHLRLISLEASICQATSSNIERHSLTEKSRIAKMAPHVFKNIIFLSHLLGIDGQQFNTNQTLDQILITF